MKRLVLKNVQLIYPNATNGKCLFLSENDPCLFPCENNRIKAPFGIWSDQLYEPVFPSHSVQPRVNLVGIHSRGYAPCELTNSSKPSLCLEAELLVDCNCSVDLISPSKEIQKLELRQESGGITARCFNNRIALLTKYEDVKIPIDLKNGITGDITKKTAIISVYERVPLSTSEVGVQCSNDLVFNEPQVSTLKLFSSSRNFQTRPSTMHVDENSESNLSILKLSPLKYAFQVNDRYGILGYPAMSKLNIGIHFGGNYIFNVDRVLEHISEIPSLTIDW